MWGSRTNAWAMLTPKGLSVRSRIFSISIRTWSSSPDDVSMIPSPPALDTADASWLRAIHPMGAWTIGTSTPSSWVTRLVMGCMAPTVLALDADRSGAGAETLFELLEQRLRAVPPIGVRLEVEGVSLHSRDEPDVD